MNRPLRIVRNDPEEPVNEVVIPADHDAEQAEHVQVSTGRPVDLPVDPEDDRRLVWATVTGRDDAERAPILPVWLHSRTDLEAGVRYHVDRWWYRVRWHLAKSPKYAARVLAWSPRGLGRVLWRAWSWAWDLDGARLRLASVQAGDADGYARAVAHHASRVRGRLPWAGLGAVAAAGSVWAVWSWAPWWVQVPVWGGALLGLARVGKPADRPFTDVSVSIERHTRLTAERVRDALCAIGISGLRDPKRITFPTEIHRDGPGQLARVNLPGGVEAVEVCERRGKLSSALRLPVDQVWPTAGPDHAGQLDLWVGYQPASKMKPPRWSIAADGACVSVFEPAEFGADQRQRAVSAPLFQRNWLIGGMPGSGKSFAARALALVAALDPTTEFKIAEYKGTGDFTDFYDAGLCSSYVCGVDDEAIEDGERILAWALGEAERRGKLIKKFRAEGRAPEGKVTPELAAADVGLHPVVIILDEVHELFGASKEAASAAERAIKRGRALNLIFILATQIPDKDSLPPGITRCVNMRWCLAVQDHVANDMILGTGSYKRGITGTSFRPEIDAGWGMVTGLSAPTVVRSQFPDEATGKRILAQAVRLRGGRPAWEEQDEAIRLDVLVDVQRVWPGGRAGATWQHLAAALAVFRPEAYGDVSPESLSALLRGLDVPSENVKDGGQVLKGCKLAAVEAAAAARELTRG